MRAFFHVDNTELEESLVTAQSVGDPNDINSAVANNSTTGFE